MVNCCQRHYLDGKFSMHHLTWWTEQLDFSVYYICILYTMLNRFPQPIMAPNPLPGSPKTLTRQHQMPSYDYWAVGLGKLRVGMVMTEDLGNIS